MASVGDKFGRLDIFLPELMDVAEIAKTVSEDIVQPRLAVSNADVSPVRGKVVLCSVKGDLHDIGKNMVKLMIQVFGFEVIDLGIDVLPRDVLNKAREVGTDIIGLSSLLTTSMPYMKETVELHDGFGMKGKFKVIVEGVPITPEYSRQIGADAFGRDAVEGPALGARRVAVVAGDVVRCAGRPGLHFSHLVLPLTCQGILATIDRDYGLRLSDAFPVSQILALLSHYEKP